MSTSKQLCEIIFTKYIIVSAEENTLLKMGCDTNRVIEFKRYRLAVSGLKSFGGEGQKYYMY